MISGLMSERRSRPACISSGREAFEVKAMKIGLRGSRVNLRELPKRRKAKIVQPPVWKGYRKTKNIESSLDRLFERKK